MNKKILRITSAIVVPLLICFLEIFFSNDGTNVSTVGNKSPAINANVVQVNYEKENDPRSINDRIDDLIGLEPEDITRFYYEYLNTGKFRNACSLMPKITCDIYNGENVQNLQKELLKHVNGYEDIEIWNPEVTGNKSRIICSKYSYVLKIDNNPRRIWEIIAFYFDKREDGEWEITSRTCEKKFKEGDGNRACPYPTSVKYCLN